MQLFQPDSPRDFGTLIRVFTILGVLLIVLAVVALAGDIFGLLDRFRPELYLFIIGALLAYFMAPAVRALQHVVRKTWAAVVGAYVLLFVVVLGFAALLVTPFVTEANSLVKHVQTPSAASLVRVGNIQRDLQTVQAEINTQTNMLGSQGAVLVTQVKQTQSNIAKIVSEASSLTAANVPAGQVSLPPSYARPIVARVQQLQSAYQQVYAQSELTIDAGRMARALSAAKQAVTQSKAIYQKAASTPLLLLSLQSTLDEHGMVVDLQDKFRQVLKTINDQVTSLLNNAVSIGVQAGNLLIDIVLIFIISIYFIIDGGRFIRWSVHLVPAASRPLVTGAVNSLDHVLGRYIRTQLLLALIAGLCDAAGALILNVPYPSVIFFSSFLLSLVPVIGPVVLPIPPLGIALVFSPLPKPIAYLVWLLVGEQIVTNVIGPRLQAHNLRIHPLEAMGAALIGLPLAGIPGVFFAVPIVAFFHIVIREFVNAKRMSGQTPADPASGSGPAPGPGSGRAPALTHPDQDVQGRASG